MEMVEGGVGIFFLFGRGGIFFIVDGEVNGDGMTE
jgi:hypothetical protein